MCMHLKFYTQAGMVCALQLPVWYLSQRSSVNIVYHIIYTYTCMYTYIAGSAICIFQMMYMHFLCVEYPLEIQHGYKERGDFERTLSPNMISDTPVESHHTSPNRETGHKLYLTIYVCVAYDNYMCLMIFIVFFCMYIYIYPPGNEHIPP